MRSIEKDKWEVGTKVKRVTRTWTTPERLGIKEGMAGVVVPNVTGLGIHVRFENGVDTYCWTEDLDVVELALLPSKPSNISTPATAP